MKTRSCYSTKADPYRAGIEIGERLAEIQPEIVFLFPSIHYQGSAELTEAIYDALENDDTVLIGNTGDGFYERERVANAGVSALGINSNGAVQWHLACETKIGAEPEQAIQRCVAQLDAACGSGQPVFYYLTSDFRTDTTDIANALNKTTSSPVIGGTAADDFAFQRSYVYVNRKVLEDSVAMLAVQGNLVFDILVAQNMIPVGRPGTITQCSKTTITSIDGIPAEQFIEQETGKPLNAADEAMMTLKIMGQQRQEQRQRSVRLSHDGDSSGSVGISGGAEVGDAVQICMAPPGKILEDMRSMASTIPELPFQPVAGLIVSCAGRKKALGDQVGQEVEAILAGHPALSALAGYPSFGEFGPVKGENGFSRPLFHNMTCFLLLIGAGPA